MYVVSIVPIASGIGIEILTYYSKLELKLGTVVNCPLRSSTLKGLVLECVSIDKSRQELRNSSFTIKKITDYGSAFQLYSPQYIDSIIQTAGYYAIAQNKILDILTPKVLLEKARVVSNNCKNFRISSNTERLLIQDTKTNTIEKYINIVNDSKTDVYIVCPTISSIYSLEKRLLGRVDFCTLHSGVTKKGIENTYLKLEGVNRKNICILVTPQYMPHNTEELDSMIIHEYSNESYINNFKAHFDMRRFIETYASKIANKTYISDLYLSESQYIPNRKSSSKYMLMDKSDKSIVGKNSKISIQLLSLLNKTQELGTNAFIYVGRKGTSTYTICDDCKTVLSCECGLPFVLFENTKKDKYYSCIRNHKKYLLDSNQTLICNNCKSWRLTPLGIGTEGLAESLRELGHKVFECDSTKLSTKKQIQSLVDIFYQTSGAVLVGTEMAIPYLDKQVSVVAATSFDGIIASSTYNADEKILYLLLRLQELAKTAFLVETYYAKLPIFTVLDQNDSNAWKEGYKMSLRNFNYPPYSVLIKIYSKRTHFQQIQTTLKEALEITDLSCKQEYSDFVTEFRLNPEVWSNSHYLQGYLASLPKECKVEII